MAIRIDASGEGLRRTTNLPNIQSWTMACWFYYVGTRPSEYNYLLSFEDAATNSSSYASVGFSNVGAFQLSSIAGSYDFTSISTGTWNFVAMRSSATNIRAYHRSLAGVWQNVGTVSTPLTFSPGALFFGTTSYGEWVNCRIAAMKVWSSPLSDTEIYAESETIRPQRYNNLLIWAPGFPGSGERSRDYSGNGYNLTELGTLTDEDGPPITFGSQFWTIPWVATSGTQTVNATVLTNTNTFYSPIVSTSVLLTRLDNTNTFYTPNVSVGNAQNVSPNVISNTNSFSNFKTSQNVSLEVANRSYSLRFNGNGVDVNRVRIPLENGTLKYPVNVGSGNFTVETWIKAQYSENTTTSLDEDARYSNIFYDRDSWGERRGHVIGVTRSGSSLVATFGQAGSGSWASISTTSNIGDNNWHHIAVTRNVSTGLVTIYIDGVSEVSGTYDTTDWSFPVGHTVNEGQDNQNLVLGCEKHDVGYYFTGELDELRISNTVKYNGSFSTSRTLTNDLDTVALYRFNDGSGTAATDSSGLNPSGTLLVGGSPSGPVWQALDPVGVQFFGIKVNHTLFPTGLDSGTVFSPTISTFVVISTNRLESSEQLFPVSISGNTTLILERLESGQIFSPTVTGSVGVSISRLDSINEFNLFQVQAGVVAVSPETIESASQVFDVLASGGLVLETLENNNAFFSPLITLNVLLDTKESESSIFIPRVISNVTLENIISGSIFVPIISVGATSILPTFLSSSNQFFTFSSDGSSSITPETIQSTLVFSPNVISVVSLSGIESQANTFNVGVSLSVFPEILSNEEALFPVLIESGGVLSRIESALQFFDFSTSYNVGFDVVESENVFVPPTIVSVIKPEVVVSGEIFSPNIQSGIIIDIGVNESQLFPVSVSTGAVSVFPSTLQETQFFTFGIFNGEDITVQMDSIPLQNLFFNILSWIVKERIVYSGRERVITIETNREVEIDSRGRII